MNADGSLPLNTEIHYPEAVLGFKEKLLMRKLMTALVALSFLGVPAMFATAKKSGGGPPHRKEEQQKQVQQKNPGAAKAAKAKAAQQQK